MKTTIKSLLVACMVIFAVTASAQQGNGGPREQRTPEERAKMMTERMTESLKLDEKQAKEVYTINLEMANNMGSDQASRTKAMEVRNEKIAKVLTPEQAAQQAKMMSEMKERGAQRGKPEMKKEAAVKCEMCKDGKCEMCAKGECKMCKDGKCEMCAKCEDKTVKIEVKDTAVKATKKKK